MHASAGKKQSGRQPRKCASIDRSVRPTLHIGDEVIMRRREFIALLSGTGVGWPMTAGAQRSAKVARIGYLSNNLSTGPQNHEAFRQALQGLGYDISKVLIERDAAGNFERLPALAAELVALSVDVIVAPSTIAALASKQVTASVPIVFATAGDPVMSGLTASLVRPGGNVTGLSSLGAQLVAKRLELLKQVIPLARLVAVLWQPSALGEGTMRAMIQEADDSGRALGVQLQLVEAREPSDLNEAFATMIGANADGLIVFPSAMLSGQRRAILDLAAKNQLPTVYPWKELVDAGGLMSYGANFIDLYRRAAIYAHRIVEGAKPADLPVEQPTKYELVINLKTAKALGVTVPHTLLASADEVIE
jgi:putative ABC transport system substrate-binding protein